ncbi:MAG TPA: phage portal protein [Pirellulales bacterium]|nr:phage portal protein [Pirellulales bacterium]
MRFTSSLDDVRRSAEGDYQHCLKAVSAGGGGALSIFAGSGIAHAQIEADSRQRVFDSREQLRHFRNQVFTSIRPIAQRIAGQPFRLAKISRPTKSRRQRVTETRQFELPSWLKSMATGMKANESFEVVDQHPILDAFSHPAPSLPGWQDWSLKYVTVASLELTGYAYWWLLPVGGRTEIWHVPSSWMRPRHSQTKLFVGWDFLPESFEEPIPLDRSEVVPFWYPDPRNTFNGLGPLEAGAQTIMVDECVIEAQKLAFQLGIHPSALIKLSKGSDNQGKARGARVREFQREQARNALHRHYRGMLRYGEPMILDGRVESVEPYGNKPSDMDFGTNADGAKARVEQIFGTNPYVAGGAGLSSRAESAESDRHFVASTVNPKIELLSRVLTLWVLPQFDRSGQYVLFIEPARPNDAEMQQAEWAQGLKSGCVTVNEYRTHVLRQTPIPGGDTALVPINTTYVKIGDTVPHPLPNGGTLAPSKPVQQTPDPDDQDPDSQDAAEAEGQEPNKAPRLRLTTKAVDDSFYDDLAERWLKSHDANETNMQGAVLEFFTAQGEAVAEKLATALGDENTQTADADAILMSVFQPSNWVDKFATAISAAFAYAVASGASHELSAFSDWSGKPLPAPADAPTARGKSAGNDRKDKLTLGYDFGVDFPPDMLRAINSAVDDALSKDYWAEIQETTKDALADSLKAGIDAGEDMRKITKRVKNDVFGGDVAKERARNIARTETTGAINAGQDVARRQLASEGIVTGKEWFATYDGLTRPTHFAANGQVKGVDEDFDVGGHPAKYPGDPNLPAKERCSCRCIGSSVTVFSKRTRAPHVKSFSSRGCEIHGKAA